MRRWPRMDANASVRSRCQGKRRLFEADGPIALRCFLLTNGSIASGVNSRATGNNVNIWLRKAPRRYGAEQENRGLFDDIAGETNQQLGELCRGGKVSLAEQIADFHG